MTYIHDQILPEGTQIGVFDIKETLKIGAFDIIYRGWNRHLKEQVEIYEYFPYDFAIRASDGQGVEPKSPSDQENFEYGLKVFLDQAENLTQIEHPNIAAVENILQLNGTAYMIMAHQEGMSLASFVQPATTVAETELKFILVSILNALQKVHECKIVHGGIQPAAIFLNKKGEPLLTHFSAARLAMAARASKLAGELASGYAPVEQYEQTREAGPATDFYALGATLYYCMTHQQPVDAQNRMIAVSKGEPDPMTLSSESMGTVYSAEWLQAINWMLRPNYSDRPQSAEEILTLLKPAHTKPAYTEDQSKPAPTQQKTMGDIKSSRGAKRLIGIGVTVGIIGSIAAGLWLNEKDSEPLEEQPNAATALLPSEHDIDQMLATAKLPEDQSVASAITPSSEPENVSIPESTSPPTATIAISQAEPREDMATELAADKEQQLTAMVPPLPQSQEQALPGKPIDETAIKAHLAAAEKAMKAVRFTTPQRDNAYKYYQLVLAIDPDNREAHSGLKKIVDRYVQFIAKARADGRLDEARLYLQRAESVLPDDPKLSSIRAELTVAKNN